MTDAKAIRKARRYSNWALRSLYFLLFALAIILPVTIVLSILAYGTMWSDKLQETFSYFSTLELSIVLFAASAFVERRRSGSKWYAFGLNFDAFAGRQFLFGGALALAAMLIIALIAVSMGYAIDFAKPHPYELINTALFFFLGATAEELMARGVFFQSIEQRFGGAVATVVMSFLFAAGHFFNPEFDILPFINTFLAGVLFSVMYIYTRSLWLPISFHFFWNFFLQVLLGSAVSGVNPYGEYISKIEFVSFTDTSKLLFGGFYGVEGGILTTILLILLIVPVIKYSNISPYLSSILYKRDYYESKLIHGEIDDAEELSGRS